MATRNIEDVMVEFRWDDKAYSANANVELKTGVEDVGPVGYREHYFCECVQDVLFDNLEIWVDGQQVATPHPELVKYAEERLMREAEAQFERFR